MPWNAQEHFKTNLSKLNYSNNSIIIQAQKKYSFGYNTRLRLTHRVCTDRQEYHLVKAKSSVLWKSVRIIANGEFECQFVKPQSYAFLSGERTFVTADKEPDCHFGEPEMHVF